MKKTLIAMAALAAAGASFAQSSVTIYGVVDAVYTGGNGSVSNSTQLQNSGLNGSRLGFKGTEDLGGGLKANFKLEGHVNNDDGSGRTTNTNNQSTGGTTGGGFTFRRVSYVGLSGGFGEVRLGRDYNPNFVNQDNFDAFGTNGAGTSTAVDLGLPGSASVRASNSIGYFLPGNLGGLYGQVNLWMGENSSNSKNAAGVSNSDDGNGSGLLIGYAAGPINVALATTETKYVAGNTTNSSLGGSYDLGVAKLGLTFARDSVSGGVTGKGANLSVNAPVGAGEVRASFSTYELDTATTPSAKKLALGYVHNLSKRTAVYVTIAQVTNSGGASYALNGAVTGADQNSTGYDIGLRHSF